MCKILKFLFFLLMPSVAAAAVNVVVVAPQEGEYSQYGNELIEGVKIAVSDANARGGVLGKKINLIVADDRCEDIYAVTMAQMLALKSDESEKISLIIGPYCKNEDIKVAEIYAAAGIVQIDPIPVYKQTKAWNIAGLYKDQVKVFIDFYKQNFPEKNVALVYDPTDDNLIGTALQLQKFFIQDNAADKLNVYSLPEYGYDYELLAKEIVNNGVVYFLAKNEAVRELVKVIKKYKEKPIIFRDRYSVDEKESDFDKQYFLGLQNFKDSPYFTETLVDLRLKGMEPSGLGIYGFMALSAWIDRVVNAKSFELKNIKGTIQNNNFKMPCGDEKYADLPKCYGVFRKTDEEYTQVY